MNEEVKQAQQECPRCHKMYIGYSAVSRVDNETRICSECGREEAIMAMVTSDSRIEMLLTIDDLDKIIIADGVTARSATDRQFHKWAVEQVAFDIGDSWPLQDRLKFCNFVEGNLEEPATTSSEPRLSWEELKRIATEREGKE